MGVFPLPGGSVGLYLLDVSGHGVGAALLSFTPEPPALALAGASLLVEGTAKVTGIVPPSRLAGRLNRQFPMDRTRQYFTLVYGAYDGSQGHYRYVVAGHPSPVLLPRTGPPHRFPAEGCRSA